VVAPAVTGSTPVDPEPPPLPPDYPSPQGLVWDSPGISNSLAFETDAYFTIALVAFLLGLFLVFFGARRWS
jgi:hypothetical protein